MFHMASQPMLRQKRVVLPTPNPNLAQHTTVTTRRVSKATQRSRIRKNSALTTSTI
ncbi:hypothetical protein RBSH_01982 [Rhodopirellula baltica SH28]|uniref:Uncharacterized protein n=1 Tax=Rhodopirellula baltica SH28 TaxID=993517 RepID=K5DIN0_RHOBT|nr:hypothetical protein RBSH_01982 [Rhodopirellula baltica SH28]